MTRKNIIKVRLTEDEHGRLKILAGKKGISTFLRTRALGPDGRQEQNERLSIVAEIARVRTILNQIGRALDERPPRAQIEIMIQLVSLEREIWKVNRQ